MKAIRIHQHGGPEVLMIDDLPHPKPKDFEVKIAIHASSLNHMDLWVRRGLPGMAALPLILGCDGAGVIVECGSEVTDFNVNDRVVIFPMTSCGTCRFCVSGLENHCPKFKIFGEHQNGTHCEFICIPQSHVMKIPEKLDFAEAASFSLVYLTSWHMLVEKAQIKPGDDVLIVGAASGVGSAAIQIAKLFGAQVIATVGGAEKRDAALALGADHVIDHYKENIAGRVKEITHRKGVEIVYEHVGLKVWTDVLKSLAWAGKLVTCGATSGPVVETDLRHIFIKQQQIIGSTMGTRADMLQIIPFIAAQKLKPVIAKIFSYQEVRQAHEYLESSQNFGKVVLDWSTK